MTITIGFTGTAKGCSRAQRHHLHSVLLELAPREVHLGDSIGADEEAYELVSQLFARTVGHIPTDDKARAFCKYDEERAPLGYIARNHAIVDESELLVACPRTMHEELRSGTWATVRYARKQGKRVIIVWPTGKVEG